MGRSFIGIAESQGLRLRAAWLEEGTAPYLASLRVDQATTWAEFREACQSFLTPSENMVWADIDGHIGWQAVGLAPRRKNWDGLCQCRAMDATSGGLSPGPRPAARVRSATRLVCLRQSKQSAAGLSIRGRFQWTEPFRFARIEEVLGSGRRFTVMDMMQLQHDEVSLPARSLVPLMRGLKPAESATSQAIDTLLSWNFVLSRDSAPAAIYVVWEHHLKRAVGSWSFPRKRGTNFPNDSCRPQR